MEVMALWPTKTLVWKNNDDRQKKQNKFTAQAKRPKQSIAREAIEVPDVSFTPSIISKRSTFRNS